MHASQAPAPVANKVVALSQMQELGSGDNNDEIGVTGSIKNQIRLMAVVHTAGTSIVGWHVCVFVCRSGIG